jgi:hypothetical protein
MAITVKNIVLWRKEIENQPGTLASTLEPFATAGADLQIVMGYRYPGNQTKAAVELYPIAGKKLTTAAETTGLKAAQIPALLVEGDNRPGLGHTIAKAVADANINLDFLVAQVFGRRYSAVIGFESSEDAKRAAALIKKTGTAKRR